MVVDMYFHHETLDKMTNMVKTYITDYLHEDIAEYDVQRIVSILWHRWYYVDGMKGFHAIFKDTVASHKRLNITAC